MFGIELNKFNKYCELFSTWFDEEESTYKNNDYKKLINSISNKYKNMDCRNRSIERVLLKDKINELTFNKVDISTFMVVPITLITYGTMEVFKKNLKNTNDAYFNALKLFLGGFSFVLLYMVIFKMVDALVYSNKRGFYTLCLDILEEIEKEKNKIQIAGKRLI
ncbi:hypothetical protein FDF15_13565 [Clostridium botulinum]|uniref:hypothetical protein n=1 Tax=Clostridium botulinum TaxID=1491 RepID=UPI0013F12449|nr:hypothetical protein [Clostridium botulinum]MBY6996505.1 hypothetical protein [Clostridium botulinum]MBY7011150.1 hypothetical protein [Clostridium botulinum]MCR1153618.1 hypothetical protein [Clostridium botulinum]MCS6165697.1 hypothetical protein [Clostridium botulinum]NEZ76206.1 hypothetical protein [Clostridium botulinum]